MKSSRALLSLIAISFLHTAAATAAGIDMSDPHRSLGREADVRIDAQLVRDTVSPGTPIGVTYQIQNLSRASVAIASKVTDASYDEETRTITLALGSEVPPDGNMPQVVVIGPGETRILQAAATPVLRISPKQGVFAVTPRYVQIKVAILRDIRPFEALIQKQDGRSRHRLPDELFEKWFECNDTIVLNSVPVRYDPARSRDRAGADAATARGGF